MGVLVEDNPARRRFEILVDGSLAGFAAYDKLMRPFVEANQEIGRLHASSREVAGPDAAPPSDADMEALMELVGRAINGLELPDYADAPDSAAA